MGPSTFESWGGLPDGLRFGYSETRLELDPDPEFETTWTHIFCGVDRFNPDLFIKPSWVV